MEGGRTIAFALWAALLTGLSSPGSPWAGGWQERQGNREHDGQKTPNQPLLSLREQGRVHFSAPPPVMVETNVKCDRHGDIYAAYSGTPLPPNGGAPPVRKIPSDSAGSVVKYELSYLPDYQSEVRLDFDVSPWGDVYYLLSAYRRWPRLEHELPDLVIVKFKSDGTMDSVTKLEQPSGGFLQANLFAAFPYGGFLVTGTLVSDPVQHIAKPFTGIYDQRGQFVREVELNGDVAAGRETTPPEESASPQGSSGRTGVDWMLAISQGNMIGAPDGNVYLLRASNPPRLLAISAGGEVLQTVTVRLDTSGWTPTGMSLAGENQALIEFGHYPTDNPSEDSKYHAFLALVNLTTGAVAGTFKAPEGTLPAACSTNSDELLFLGTSKQSTLDVVKFAPPDN